jgi:hypothetical protein
MPPLVALVAGGGLYAAAYFGLSYAAAFTARVAPAAHASTVQ